MKKRRRRTKYNNHPVNALGCKFRSKFEFRAARCFEKLGIKWQFEPRVTLGHRYCLPDFYLPEYNTFIELRPAKLVDSDLINKIKEIKYTYQCEVVLATDISGVSTFISRLDESRKPSNPDKIWVFSGKQGELKDVVSMDTTNSK